jgi:hypothetical protein
MNHSLIELELGVISDESLGYLADFLAKNSSVKNIAFEEGNIKYYEYIRMTLF